MATAWPPFLEEQTSRRSMSVDDWLALPEDEDGELVDEELVEEEVPDAVHELAVMWLARLFWAWLGARGFVFGSELKTITAGGTGRKPDLSVFLPDRPPPRRRGGIREPADVIVEVVSPSARDGRRDRVEKMAEYAAFGVRCYWLVDPAQGTFEVFERNADGNYTKVVGVIGGRVDRVPGCDGLVVDVDALWAELARLGPEE